MAVPGDAELVAAVLRGNKEAFGPLVQRYEAVVAATAQAIMRDSHAAQDVTQNAFVTAYRKLAALHRPAAFGPWILRITRRLAFRGMRRRRHSPQPGESELLNHTPDPAAAPAQPPGRNRLQAALARPCAAAAATG